MRPLMSRAATIGRRRLGARVGASAERVALDQRPDRPAGDAAATRRRGPGVGDQPMSS